MVRRNYVDIFGGDRDKVGKTKVEMGGGGDGCRGKRGADVLHLLRKVDYKVIGFEGGKKGRRVRRRMKQFLVVGGKLFLVTYVHIILRPNRQNINYTRQPNLVASLLRCFSQDSVPSDSIGNGSTNANELHKYRCMCVLALCVHLFGVGPICFVCSQYILSSM